MKKSGAAVSVAEQENFAEQLNPQVAQRIAELTEANEQLRRELAEQERAEALREGEFNLNLIVDSIPVPVAVTSPSGEVEALNKPTLEYFGRTFEELKGWKSSDVVHPDDRQRTIAAQMEAHKTGHSYNVQSRHRRADGVYRWFNVLGLPLRDAQGRIRHWFHLQIDIDDRKRAEEALRSAERNLSLTINTIPTFIQVSRPDGTVLSVNQAVLDYYGVTLLDMQKEDFRTRVYHPDDVERLREERNEALKRPLQFEYEQRALGKDGKYRWFLVRYNPLLDDEGKIERWYATAFDIEDRKRAEAQLAGEKRLLEMVASGHAVTEVLTELCKFVEDTGGECKCGIYLINWGTATFRLGAAPSLPATFNDPVDGLTVTSDAGPCGLAALTKSQVLVTDINTDPRFQTATIRPLLLAHGIRSHWSTPIYSGDGQVLGTFAIFQNHPSSPTQLQLDLISQVTHIASIAIERALSEAALKRSEAFLAEAQQLSRIGSFSWRVPTNEITWSEQLYRIYQLDSAEPVTLELIRTRVHPEDLTLYEKMVEQARNGADDFEWQYRLLMPDQSIKYLHAVAQATHDQDGQLEYIAAVQDVTARRVSEEALDKARSELARITRVMSLGALTASIAHEVNQPLSGIITNASTCVRMLENDPPNVDGARETAKRTIRDGRRATDVITRLRALFTHKDGVTESIDLNEATREVILLSRTELERNGVITRTELAAGLPLVTGDRVQLQQVILNLLRNGSDAMSSVDDRPRELWFRTEVDEDDRVRLSVRDAGIGFEPQSLDQLFRPFYTTKEDGMGIGLTVSRSIIENHGGHLSAKLNDGPGVTFSFSIPCVVDESKSPH
jgi:PAS domain S-box-containing protein